jgi:hypothetical protein
VRKIRSIASAILISLLAACVTIPQESVDLSSEVGIGLQRQYQSQVDLVNLYFSIKRKNLDEMMKKALDRYFEEITPGGSVTLSKSQLSDVAVFVTSLNVKNNVAKEELEKARDLLIKRLNENYLVLNQANSSVTGLLQSAVTVKSARSEAFRKFSESTGSKVDLEKAFEELDDFVAKGGERSGKAIKLADKLKQLLGENTRR